MYDFYVFFRNGAYMTVSGPSLEFVGEKFLTANIVRKDLLQRLIRFEL